MYVYIYIKQNIETQNIERNEGIINEQVEIQSVKELS